MILAILFIVFMIGAAAGAVWSALWWCGVILFGLHPMTEEQMMAVSVASGLMFWLSYLALLAFAIIQNLRGR